MINNIYALDGSSYIVNDETDSLNVSGPTGTGFDNVFKVESRQRSLEDIFVGASKEYNIPLELLKAVAQAESAFDVNAVSPCGASGVMQLMPSTAEGLGVTDVFDPEQNIYGGAKLLSSMIECYNGDVTLALAAYNAGWGAVEEYGGVPPYEETQNYIAKIFNILAEGQTDVSSYYVEEPVSHFTNNVSDVPVYTSNIKHTGNSDAAQLYGVAGRRERYRTITFDNEDISKMSITERISYESYMKLLDEFQDILQSVFFSDSSSDSDNKIDLFDQGKDTDKSKEDTVTYQNLYQATSSMYNSRAWSLMNL